MSDKGYQPYYKEGALVPSGMNILGKWFQNRYIGYFGLGAIAYFGIIFYYMYLIFLDMTIMMTIKIVYFFILITSSLLLIRKVNNQHNTFRMLIIAFNYLFKMKKYYRIEMDERTINKRKKTIKVAKL